MTEMRYYNGVTESEIGNAYGLQKLGIEKCKPFFTRGLVDIGGQGPHDERGRGDHRRRRAGGAPAAGHAEADIKSGDGVFFNTGWGELWMKDNDKFNSGEPGIGLDVAGGASTRARLVGPDTWATEVVPNPNTDLAFAVHNELITKNGIFNHENLDFTELIEDKSQFVYIFAPLRSRARRARRPDRDT